MIVWYTTKIKINRPLILLCGCSSGEEDTKDRRRITRKYIAKYRRASDGLIPIPFIVDDIINEKVRKETGIDIALVEEILSAISYRTYIYLDTMSTGYELGQFFNSKTNNNIRVFVDDQSEQRQHCPIGQYIKLATQNCFNEYKGEYDSKAYIYFNGDELPDSISKKIDHDFDNYNIEEESISLNYFENRATSNEKYIGYYEIDGKLFFSLTIKQAFYLLCSVTSKIYDANLKEKRILKSDVTRFKKDMCEMIYKSFFAFKPSGNLIFIKPAVSISIENYDVDNLLLNMLKLWQKLSESTFKRMLIFTGDSITLGREGDDNVIEKNDEIKECLSNVFRLSSFDSKLIDDYRINQDKFVEKRIITRGNKKRLIVTYNTQSSGSNLKKLHLKIVKSLNRILESSENSYAYKKNKNCMMCFKPHKDSLFYYKIDIKSYFHSISFSAINKLISEYIRLKIRESDLPIYNNDVDYSILKSILSVLFYNYSLPIGFCSSPIISDFYLYTMDEKMNKIEGVTYSRYSDDILISSKSNELLLKAKFILLDEIKKMQLAVNDKTITRKLAKEGDSFKFLGINLCLTNGKRVFTIGKKYIIETCKMFSKYLEDRENCELFNKLKGRCEYIKYVSRQSFNKLNKMCIVKTKHSIKILDKTKYSISI